VFSQGFICPKGSTLKQLHEDPDRVRRPLIRRGGELVEATWDEAFAAVADGLAQIWADGDRNAVGLYLGNPSAHTIAGTLYGRPLIQALGTRNLFSASTVDQMPAHVSAGLMFGNPGAIPVPDLDRTDYLLMLGANPFESNGSLCTAPDFPGRMAAIRERGGRIVVVDPRRTKSADAADEHIAIRPGTDALWLAAICTELLGGAVDLGHAAAFVADVDATLATLRTGLAPFTADTVAERTRVPADLTRRIAGELAAAPSATVYGRIGTHTTRFGTIASWLADVATAVSGNLDRPGGSMFAVPASGRPRSERRGGRGFKMGRWTSRVSGMPEVRSEFPTATMADEILTDGPGQVRAMITVGGNPVRSCQDSNRLDEAFAALEFQVSVDIYVNETTRHADVILPSPSSLEKAHYDLAFQGLSIRNTANYSPPVFEAEGPDECDIMAKLALIAQGLGPDADPGIVHQLMLDGATAHAEDPAALQALSAGRPGPERIIDATLRLGPYDLSLEDLEANPHGVDLGALTPALDHVTRTTDAMIDLAPEPFMADLTRLAAELDDTDDDDGLLLVGRRHLRSNNSWMHNLAVLTKGAARCTLQIHPADAALLGVVHEGQATVRSAVGAVVAPVEVTDSIAQGTVSLPHGWGHDVDGVRLGIARRQPNVNSNVLTDASVIDPLSGNGQLNAIPVVVTPA